MFSVQRPRNFLKKNLSRNGSIISYHVVVVKRQNRLKVGTDKPKLNVKTQSNGLRPLYSDILIHWHLVSFTKLC